MIRLSKYVEGATYFYFGAVLILALDYIARSLGYRFGYNHAPEVGPGIGMLALLFLSVAYYGVFVVVQHGLSRFCRPVLDRQYLLPASLAVGVIVSFSFVSSLDFLFWLLYRKDMGTIFLSVLVIELLFLLINHAIVWRVVMAERLPAPYVRMAVLALIFIGFLIIFWLPEIAGVR